MEVRKRKREGGSEDGRNIGLDSSSYFIHLLSKLFFDNYPWSLRLYENRLYENRLHENRHVIISFYS